MRCADLQKGGDTSPFGAINVFRSEFGVNFRCRHIDKTQLMLVRPKALRRLAVAQAVVGEDGAGFVLEIGIDFDFKVIGSVGYL